MNLQRDCLECGMTVTEIFDPCPTCGTRPTDPNIRRGESKVAYDRSRGASGFLSHLKHRAQVAKKVEHDTLTEMPVLTDSVDSFDFIEHFDADAQTTRHMQQNRIRRHGGGIPGKNLSGSGMPALEGGLTLILIYLVAAFVFNSVGDAVIQFMDK